MKASLAIVLGVMPQTRVGVIPERQLIAAYLIGLSAYVSATLRGRIDPRMTFPEVQAIDEEIGIAAKALAACPFLGRDARARALQHREKVFRKEPLPLPHRHTPGEDFVRGPASTPQFRASGSPRPTVPFRSAEAAATETKPQEPSLEQPHHPAENE
jgi:hypothetical protein